MGVWVSGAGVRYLDLEPREGGIAARDEGRIGPGSGGSLKCAPA